MPITPPEVSQITLPSGNSYALKDAQAREDIEILRQSISGGVSFIGETSTALSDQDTTNPIIINGVSTTVISGNVVYHGTKEFLYDGTKWIEFGDLGGLGALAYKSSASGSFTPSGSISKPNISVTPTSGSIEPIDSVGVLPTFTATVASEVLTLSYSQGSLPTKGTAVTVLTGVSAELDSTPTFTGTAGTVSVT